MAELPLRATAHIDLAAIRGNVARLDEMTGDAAVLAVVKADGYGHGIVESARAALAGGASWLGVAFADEALALRGAGIDSRVLCWLLTPDEDLAALIDRDVDVSISASWALHEVAAAARDVGRVARVHIKVDTGLSRAGVTAADWPHFVEEAAKVQADGAMQVVGIWSHFAHADAPNHPTTAKQIERFNDALDVATRAGLHPEVRHLANSAATLTLPHTHFDLVRPGIAVYGLSPVPGEGDFGLRPAMTLTTRIALIKRVPRGSGVSYGHRYTTSRDTNLALVPVGYGDGIPRNATNTAHVLIGGRCRQISGTVCMDQFMVDVGHDEVAEGDEVVLFGPGDRGEPTAQEWAEALDTISYEIVTRIGPRVPRVYVGGSA